MFHCHASVAYLCKNGRLACGRTLIFDMYGDDDMMADLLFAVSIVVVFGFETPWRGKGGEKTPPNPGDGVGGGWPRTGVFFCLGLFFLMQDLFFGLFIVFVLVFDAVSNETGV